MEQKEFIFENICRTCKNTSNDMKYLFDNIQMQNDSLCFADMLMACTSVQVSNEDGLPALICDMCINKLRTAFDFKRQCELIDTSFRTILKNRSNLNAIKQEITDETNLSSNDQDDLDFNTFFTDTNCDSQQTKPKIEELEQFLKTEDNERSQTANFVCSICFKMHTNESLLNRHMRIHFPNKIFRCKICNKTLTRLEHTKRHMITHLRNKPHVCGVCKRGFNKADNLASHAKRCEGQRPHICPICNRGFMREDSLQVHIGTHDSNACDSMILDTLDDIDKYILIEEYPTGKDDDTVSNDNIFFEPQVSIDENSQTIKLEVDDKLNFCDKCNKQFSSKVDYVVHEQRHLSKNVFSCTVCDKQFNRADHLKRHMYSRHEDVKPFQCDTCLKMFTRRDHLLRHQRVHNTEKLFICEQCPEQFARDEQLTRHMASKHGIGEKLVVEKKFECHVCNKLFTTEKYRDIHMKAHSFKVKTAQCKGCEQVFISKEELNKHLKVTNDCSRRFLCSECGQRFTKKDYLQVHIRRHRGEKPFKCRFCEKGFPRTTDLKAHEKCHTGEKNHLCIVCGKGFGRAYKLTLHMRTHTGEKPYVCTYCDAAFAQSNDLKAHVRRHTGERYYCDLCDDAFLMGYMLTQHKKNVHGVDIPESHKHLARLNQSAPQPIKPEIRRPINNSLAAAIVPPAAVTQQQQLNTDTTDSTNTGINQLHQQMLNLTALSLNLINVSSTQS